MTRMKVRSMAILLIAALFAILPEGDCFAISGKTAFRADVKTAIVTAIENRQNSLEFTDKYRFLGKNEFRKLMDEIFSENNNMKYYIESWSYQAMDDGNRFKISLEFKYRETLSQKRIVELAVEDIISRIITPGANDYSKMKAIHDYVISHVEYDRSLSNATPLDAISGKATCQGYALLCDHLMNSLGYETMLIEGDDHLWNLVKIQGRWYHIDTTFDDPSYKFIGSFSEEEKKRIKDRIIYDNFLKSDKDMIETGHKWDKRKYPKCDQSWPTVQ